MRTEFKRFRVLALALGLLLVLAACGGGADDTDTTTTAAGSEGGETGGGETRTTLVASHPQEPPNWNYWETGSSALRVPTYLSVQESLLETLADGSLAPLLATDYEVSEDGTVYTLTIREAKFHDGTDLDSADVKYSLEKNAESPLAATSAPLSGVVSIDTPDERTVVVTLDQPSQRFLTNLGRASGIIVPEGSHEELDLAQTVPGTGPYVFGEYRPDVDLTLNRFEDYWGDKPFFETITHRFIPDETAAINALRAGEIDIVGALLGEGKDQVATVGASEGFTDVYQSGLEVSYVFLNTNVEALQDDRVRQAIAHAIDRGPLVDAALAGIGNPTCLQVTPFSAPYNSDYCPYPHDVEKAKELLADAGYADGLTLDFPFLTVAEFPPSMEVLVSQLAAAGITLETRGLDLATWLERVNTNGEYEFTHLTSGATLDTYISGAGRQPLGTDASQVTDEEFDSLIEASDSIIDRDEYLEVMSDAAKRFADIAWVIPLFSPDVPTLARDDIEGLPTHRTLIEFDYAALSWAD